MMQYDQHYTNISVQHVGRMSTARWGNNREFGIARWSVSADK